MCLFALRQVTQLYTNKAHMIAMGTQLQEQLAIVKVAGTLSKSSEVMKLVNDMMQVPLLQLQTSSQFHCFHKTRDFVLTAYHNGSQCRGFSESRPEAKCVIKHWLRNKYFVYVTLGPDQIASYGSIEATLPQEKILRVLILLSWWMTELRLAS